MPKFLAPAIVASLCFDTVEYERDSDGLFEIKHPDHIAAGKMHGLVEYDDTLGQPVEAVVARIPSDFDTALSDKDDEIAALKARLAALEGHDATGATATAHDPADASGDTLEAAGDASEAMGEGDAPGGDTIGTALSLDPQFDTMTRDELVAWLDGVGVTVPGNLSTAKAREIVDQTVAEYRSAKGE